MATTDPKTAWSKVGDELSSLGLKLKLHVEQERSEDVADDDDVDSALKRLGDALDSAIDAIENAAEDKAIREDLRQTGRLLTEAITATFQHARTEIKKSTKS